MTPETIRYEQATQYSSPHPFSRKVRMLVWELTWTLLCGWTPKPFYPWRIAVLRAFGADIPGTAFVHSRARIPMPWNLTMLEGSTLGDRTSAYCLGRIEIQARATVAQEAYLSAGSHDFTDPAMPLVTKKITVGEDVFIGARAFVLPGVTIGQGAVIGAASVVTRDVPPWMFAAGNPCRPIRPRVIAGRSREPEPESARPAADHARVP